LLYISKHISQQCFELVILHIWSLSLIICLQRFSFLPC
jgi:hypothetical protein